MSIYTSKLIPAAPSEVTIIWSYLRNNTTCHHISIHPCIMNEDLKSPYRTTLRTSHNLNATATLKLIRSKQDIGTQFGQALRRGSVIETNDEVYCVGARGVRTFRGEGRTEGGPGLAVLSGEDADVGSLFASTTMACRLLGISRSVSSGRFSSSKTSIRVSLEG